MGQPKFHTANKFKGRRRKSRNANNNNNSGNVVSESFAAADVVTHRVSDDVKAGTSGGDLDTSLCSTTRKLDKFKEKVYSVDYKSSSGNRIVEFDFLTNLVGSFSCSHCKGNNLSLQETNQFGLSSILLVTCNDCLNEKKFSTSRRMADCSNSFEINRLAVTAFREIGCGQAASQSWFAAMNIPISLAKKTFASHSKVLSNAAVETGEEILEESRKIVRQAYTDIDPSMSTISVIDISVAFDGTWHRRGHRSHYGVGVATDLLTGLVIDYEVMSTYCFGCQVHSKEEKSTQKYKEWFSNHKEHCNKNFSGSANAMESASALKIWNRSIEKNSFRYTTLLGDGDSKTYHNLLEAKPYGKTMVMKEECVNHVSKRMGTALKNLVTQCRAEGNPISGKGRLTQERILKLQNYYGKAIKDNAHNLDAMRNAVWAVLLHSISTDEEPHHSRCPSGETSWCWWQRFQAKGQEPPPQGHHNPLPKHIGEKMVPIFKRLGADELLKRCLQGKNQNINECINGIIWQRCPKVRFTGLSTIKYAVAKGISVFNKGALASLDIAAKMGVNITQHALSAANRRNRERKRKSEEQSLENVKRARKARKIQNSILCDKQQAEEGTSYQSGSF